MSALTVVYLVVAALTLPLAFIWLAASEADPPTAVDGLAIMLASAALAALWPLSLTLAALAVGGRAIAYAVWTSRNPVVQPDPETGKQG